MSAAPEGAALPVWANLIFVDACEKTRFRKSVLLHGLPAVGTSFEAYDDAGDYAGDVYWINFAPATDGSYKPSIWVRAKR